MSRYLSLLGVQLRTSWLLAMQYRWEFMLDGFFSAFWTVTALLPLYLVFQERPVIAGWRYGEALMVIGWFTLLQGALEGAINPSLATTVEHIRSGTLDHLLLKPADAQFLVSTTRFQPWKVLSVVAAIFVFAFGFHSLGRAPRAQDVALSLVMLCAALVVLYSLWILVISAAFHFVRVDNLRHLFIAVFDAARWPATVFKGAAGFLFTFVIPLALMTTYPAQALLGTLEPETLVASLFGAAFFALASRWIWTRSIRSYTSASS